MKVVVAPDSFGGTLTPRQAAEAIAEGWGRARPDDDLRVVPLADGGEGTLGAVAVTGGTLHRVEVAGPLAQPVDARFLLRDDGTAIVESAEACGLRLVPPAGRDPLRTTTYGVGQLLEAVRRSGARRVLVGLGGSATVDGGAGALTALGLRLRREDGSGLKVGGGELAAVDRVERGWLSDGWSDVEVVLWSDVRTTLPEAAATYGPQKGATPGAVTLLEGALERWADVIERDLGGGWRTVPGSGAAGGLGFALLAALAARIEPGAAAVAREVGLADALAGADLVVTGEGRYDATSLAGKVVGQVIAAGADAGVAVFAVVGQLDADAATHGLAGLEAVASGGGQHDHAAAVAGAAERLAQRVS